MPNTHAPTYAQLRLQLAQSKLAHAHTLAAYNLLRAATAGTTGPVRQPGPRWGGAAH